MEFLHKEFDLQDGEVIEVTLDNPANVQLLDAANYEAYRDRKPYRYYGGYAPQSPFQIPVPQSGRWHLVVDLGGNVGRVRASAAIVSPVTA